jgi:hypothetical protein
MRTGVMPAETPADGRTDERVAEGRLVENGVGCNVFECLHE